MTFDNDELNAMDAEIDDAFDDISSDESTDESNRDKQLRKLILKTFINLHFVVLNNLYQGCCVLVVQIY